MTETKHQITPSLAAEIKASAEETAELGMIILALQTLMVHQDPVVRGLAEIVNKWANDMAEKHGSKGIQANSPERSEFRLKHQASLEPAGFNPLGRFLRGPEGWSLRVSETAKTKDFSIEPEIVRDRTMRDRTYAVDAGTVIRVGLHEIHLLAPDEDQP